MNLKTTGQNGSVSVSCVLRLDGGELCATVGVEGNAEVVAEAPEFGWVERNSDHVSTTTAGLLFALLGTLKPKGIPDRQKVTVFHHGLDFVVLLNGVPALRDAKLSVHA